MKKAEDNDTIDELCRLLDLSPSTYDYQIEHSACGTKSQKNSNGRSLKTEKLNRLSFMNHQSVIAVVESYIRFYTYKRLHSAIGNITPAERKLEIRNAA